MQEAKAEAGSLYIGAGAECAEKGPAAYTDHVGKEKDGAYSSCKVIGSGGLVAGVISS